eukprot:9918139-Alexandrium_andersonii.AAC.1
MHGPVPVASTAALLTSGRTRQGGAPPPGARTELLETAARGLKHRHAFCTYACADGEIRTV